ncbi:hypothetical protein XO10_05560 [Marinitoga sp. 1135]|uniref:hypothetical protein n=1 Tax=Marinitoga sp. 1135 TaxID=1643333 RepID=UPI0015862A40|nr:hypothetical protein [Marinitoga sp. 1135]NUU95739.1 hypothetical protein [Marinitoga sp. 1135]
MKKLLKLIDDLFTGFFTTTGLWFIFIKDSIENNNIFKFILVYFMFIIIFEIGKKFDVHWKAIFLKLLIIIIIVFGFGYIIGISLKGKIYIIILMFYTDVFLWYKLKNNNQ